MVKGKTEGGSQKAEALDRAIDLAVREMLDVEPRADLRARVIERIERPGASVGRVFRPGVRWTWIVAPVAAAAVLVLAVMLWKPEERLGSRPVTSIVLRPLDARQPVTIARSEAPRNPPPMHPTRPHERRITAAIATADDTNFSAEPPAGFAVVGALAPPSPIVVEQIPSAAASAVTSLDIAPLRLAALEVNALPDSPRERREE